MSDPRYTADDLDAIDTLPMSPGFPLFLARVQQLLDRRRREIEQDGGPEETAKLRGRIDELKTVLGLQEIMRDEMRAELKEKPNGR